MSRLASAVLITVLALVALQPAAASAAVGDPVLDLQERALCRKINAYRGVMGRPALRLSAALTRSARWMAADLAENDYFSHTDSLGRTFVPRLNAFGYDFGVSMAENLAAGFDSGFSTYSQWRASPAHDTSMLNANYRVMGIGRAYNPNSTYKWYWTADFGGYMDRTIPC